MQSNYADVILDITHANVDRPFTYAVPEEMKDTVRPGMPVKLPFGNGNRVRTGYVIALYETAPEVPWELKTILGPAEKQVSAEASLVTLALWMHDHYGCMLSQALKTVMPVKSRVKKKKTKTPSSLPGDGSREGAAGMEELMGAVERTIGFSPDAYLLVNMDAFVDTVDLMVHVSARLLAVPAEQKDLMLF